MDIIRAQTKDHMDQIRNLFLEYEAFLNVDLCFQGFQKELSDLPGDYGPPDGSLLLAMEGQQAFGCGALRKLYADTCEMKRLYLKSAYRGSGIGKALVRKLIEEARHKGYAAILLDTLDNLKTAMGIYESLGFVRIEPYYNNPLPGVVYWRLDLRMG